MSNNFTRESRKLRSDQTIPLIAPNAISKSIRGRSSTPSATISQAASAVAGTSKEALKTAVAQTTNLIAVENKKAHKSTISQGATGSNNKKNKKQTNGLKAPPKPSAKIECITAKINGVDLNQDPLLIDYVGHYVHYPIGKLSGTEREEVKFKKKKIFLIIFTIFFSNKDQERFSHFFEIKHKRVQGRGIMYRVQL